MTIRKGKSDDLEEIYSIYSDRYDSHDDPSIKYTLSDWEWYLSNDRALIFVLEDRSRILGVTLSYDMGIWGYMEHVVIKREHRNKGYAKALIEHTMEEGERLGWRIFEACYYQEIESMKNFFERIGWSDSGISTRWVFKEQGKASG